MGLRNEGDPLPFYHVVLPETDEILGLFTEKPILTIFYQSQWQLAERH